MELEEPDDEEWTKLSYTTTTSSSKYYLYPKSDGNNNSDGNKVCWVWERGFNIGKKILVAGLVASSAPIVVPPLVVASAIGIAVSMPYAFFLASHACTETLMSRLLPRPTITHHDPINKLILDDFDEGVDCFEKDVVGVDTEKEEGFIECEADREIGMVGSDYGQEVVVEKEEEEEEENAEPQMIDCVKLGEEKEDEGMMQGNEETQMYDDVVKIGDEKDDEGIMEGNAETQIDGFGDENEEFKAPFEVTTVSVEEFGDEAIEEEELQRETKGLLEKIRDEGRNDSGREFLDGSTNESDHENGPVVENFEVPHEEEDRRVYKEMLESINDENKDTIYAEVESADEPVIGMLEEKEVDDKNDSLAEMAEHSEQLDGGSFQFETIPAEPVGELMIEEDYSVPVTEDSSEVTGEKIDIEEPRATVMQEGKLDNNISDSGNQESQLREHNEIMDSSNADATKIADERGFDLSDEKTLDPDEDAYRIDFHEESSSVVVDGNTAPTEVPVSASEQELKPSECSPGKDVICPSAEVAFDEESIWKQIHVIRKIIGYESTAQASCADELKALYIFTGVEPPKFLNENLNDPAEINEKLHFLMSIVGVK